MQQVAKIAQQKAEKTGLVADQKAANQAIYAAQKAMARYCTALANMRIEQSQTETEYQNGGLNVRKLGSSSVEMLDEHTGVVMPAPMNNNYDKHVETPYSNQHQLPQTDESQNARGGILAGVATLMGMLGFLGAKKRKQAE